MFNKSNGSKGYENQDACDVILGLAAKINNFIIEINVMNDNIHALSSNKIEIDSINCANAILEDKITDTLQIAVESRNKAAYLEIEMKSIKNSTSLCSLLLVSYPVHALLKLVPMLDVHKLLVAQSLSTKEISKHLSVLKIPNNWIQSIILYYSAIVMMTFARTREIVSSPICDKIDEHFHFRNEFCI